MTLLWFSVFGGFVVRLIRQHGWEYVPLVVLSFAARVYDPGQALIWDSLALATMGGIWIVTRRDITCDDSPSIAA